VRRGAAKRIADGERAFFAGGFFGIRASLGSSVCASDEFFLPCPG
jgi:hypothetical protein